MTEALCEFRHRRTMRLRSTLAGWLFLLAGKLDKAYDVWLDEAQRKDKS